MCPHAISNTLGGEKTEVAIGWLTSDQEKERKHWQRCKAKMCGCDCLYTCGIRKRMMMCVCAWFLVEHYVLMTDVNTMRLSIKTMSNQAAFAADDDNQSP